MDVLIEPLVVKEVAFALPTKPGLGIELNKEVFDQNVYKPRDPDHLYTVREIVLKYCIETACNIRHPEQTAKYHIIPMQTLNKFFA